MLEDEDCEDADDIKNDEEIDVSEEENTEDAKEEDDGLRAHDDIEADEAKQLLEEESKKVNLLRFKTSPEHKPNMYFDNDYVTDLIVNKYQPSLKYDENGKIIERDEAALNEIMANLLLIANAIINKYSYWRFDTTDDLLQEALKEMYKYLPKFTPGKGSAFDLFSIICKRHLLNYTLRFKKHRLTADVDIHPEVESKEEESKDIFFESFEQQLLEIINLNFKEKQREEYIEMASILMDYIVKNNGMIIGKNDMMSHFRSYGKKSTEYKKFIKDLDPFKEQLYQIVKN